MNASIASVVLVSTIIQGVAAPASFFEDLEEAYLVVLTEIVKPPDGPFSVSIATVSSDSEGPRYLPLPDSIWEKLSPRLVAQGKDVSSYVRADKMGWERGNIVHLATKKRARVFHVYELKWLGDDRLYFKQTMISGSLSGSGYTLVMQKKNGLWKVVERTDPGMANKSSQATAATRLAFDRSL
jgi:hypothetical protein